MDGLDQEAVAREVKEWFSQYPNGKLVEHGGGSSDTPSLCPLDGGVLVRVDASRLRTTYVHLHGFEHHENTTRQRGGR